MSQGEMLKMILLTQIKLEDSSSLALCHVGRTNS